MSKGGRKPGMRSENSLYTIGDQLGMTRQNAEHHLKQGIKKIQTVHNVGSIEYARTRQRATKIVTESVEHALKHDDFLAQLSMKLTYWMLQERRDLLSSR